MSHKYLPHGITLISAIGLSAILVHAQPPVNASAPRLTTIYSFQGPDGANPQAGVLLKGGVLYGATYYGGTTGQGTAFSLTPASGQPSSEWRETVLHNFTGLTTTVPDAAYPFSSLLSGVEGVLYGTALGGGIATGACGAGGCGTIFSLQPTLGHTALVYSFGGYPTDGSQPVGLVRGPDGVLYGTSISGGPYVNNYGTVFSLTPPATARGAWTEKVLHNFGSFLNDGTHPLAGVVVGPQGVLYGTTSSGGKFGSGTVFSLAPPAYPDGSWTENILHDFTGGSDGDYPFGGLLIGDDGTLYGTTVDGGTGPTPGCGVVFVLAPPSTPGGQWKQQVLHQFQCGAADGAGPQGALARGPGGVLYGATFGGGTSGYGSIFSLAPPRSPHGQWTETVLYSFTGSSDGNTPTGGLVMGEDGMLYGTTFCTYIIGASRYGTVFSLKP